MTQFKIRDLTDQVFGRLLVVSHAGTGSSRKALWYCRCECGNTLTVRSGSLVNGNTNSCGCLKVEILAELHKTHGLRYEPEYAVWLNMKDRCNNPNNNAWMYYGGRGIKLCQEWNDSFVAFYNDMGSRPKKHQIDRIDSNKGYYKENCRWVIKIINDQNKRNSKFWFIDGVRYNSLSHAADHFGVGICTIKSWCEGQSSTHKGKVYSYPPKNNCWSECKYER